MERTFSWIRENPQFAALAFAVAVLALVLTVLAITMTRAGASLRPLVWFFGFVAIVAGPQAAVHLLDGFVLRAARSPGPNTPAVAAAPLAEAQRTPVAWERVFGTDADPALITDAKRGLAAILNDTSEAKLSFSREGASALAARFASEAAAARALDAYARFFAFAQAQGSDAQGWTARRHGGQGEWVHIVTAGRELYAWTGANRDAVLAHRWRALGPVGEIAPRSAAGDNAHGPILVSRKLSRHAGLMAGIVSLNLIAAGLWFFKGSAWAARIEGSNATVPASASMLRNELVGLAAGDAPIATTARPDGAIEVNWRYADARWFDLMRVQRMKRAHKLILWLDEANKTVRVREYWSALDASAGARDLRFDWKAATGIQFFAFEHVRVVGAQLGRDGKPTGELSGGYTFDLQALKRPLIAATTRAGWRWQPVTWNAPESLRWITE
jgi:hypothetical protein